MRRIPSAGMYGVPSSAAPSTSTPALLAMPVQLFGGVGVVVDVHPRPLALFQPDQRSGELIVVYGGRHDLIWAQLDCAGGDSQCVVRLAVGWGRRRGSRTSDTADCDPVPPSTARPLYLRKSRLSTIHSSRAFSTAPVHRRGCPPIANLLIHLVAQGDRRLKDGLGPAMTGRIRTSTNLPNPVADIDADKAAYRRILLRGRLRVSNLLAAGNRFR